MKTTWLSRLLCRIGIHALVWKTWEGNGSLIGGCVRCNESFQWDF